MAELHRQSLSPENPWPGLDPFDEADRAYFHGRAAESGELVRLVRRELLTVLFGRSGLGKTSLLKAGLFPELRDDDALPVYVRLDHAEGAPALREQIFRELHAECAAARVQAARPAGDESLWSFFHRRDAEFWSDRNRPVTPVLVLDQFEEIFTLGEESEEARVRSAAFLAELGDLVENRPPAAVQQELEADPTAARRFDFKRAPVKLVLSFREDFLAEMEGLKEQMPSLMYNRFRLLAMSGTQAYEVITRAGGPLVGDDIARRILRLAWKNEPSPPVEPADFPKLEIDPALLSVVCSELNHKRQKADPPLDRITPTLLEGADREILSGFYERALAGLDPRVRAFVEDELITGRGYRDSHAREDALALPGVTADALDALVRRRLLRVDERQTVRRLELTHDVLTRVVLDSRDSRRAREAEEAAKARERAAREQQRRNRRNSALVGAGALVVIVLLVFAYWSAWEASEAEKKVQDQQHEAESMRLKETADWLQDDSYDVSLLVNLEAARTFQTRDASAGLLQRFVSHPHLSAFLAEHQSRVLSVAFSPDGKLLASSSGDGTVILWDVDSHKLLGRLPTQRKAVNAVAFSRNGKLLASASDAMVTLWDVANLQVFATLPGHEKEVTAVAFSEDGKLLASASRDGLVILWDVGRHQWLAAFPRHKTDKTEVTDVAFSQDGKLLASASTDGLVILWEIDNHKLLATLPVNKKKVKAVAFSPDGNRLAAASQDGTVTLWNVANRQPVANLLHRPVVNDVSFSPDGKLLATASDDYTVVLWDVDGNREPQRLKTLVGHKKWVKSVTFSEDGNRLASASWDNTVILWDLSRRKALAPLKGHTAEVKDVAFSQDGEWLASASWDKKVLLWDVNHRKEPAKLTRHEDWVEGVAFREDGKQLASAGKDKRVVLWDVVSHSPLPELKEGHKDRVYSVAFSRDGRWLASASEDDTVILWRIAGGAGGVKMGMLSEHKDAGAFLDVAFSPDGERLATATKRTVVLWDVASRQPLATLPGHEGAVSSVTFSLDGKSLASASYDQTVILWDVASGKKLATLLKHKSAVLAVAFSQDDKQLVSAGQDGTIILWDIERRKPLATLKGHEGAVWGVAFSPDGRRLASASADRTVILWDLDLDHLKAEACRTANRNLTCDEWRSYIGAGKLYHKTCEELPGPEKCE